MFLKLKNLIASCKNGKNIFNILYHLEERINKELKETLKENTKLGQKKFNIKFDDGFNKSTTSVKQGNPKNSRKFKTVKILSR